MTQKINSYQVAPNTQLPQDIELALGAEVLSIKMIQLPEGTALVLYVLEDEATVRMKRKFFLVHTRQALGTDFLSRWKYVDTIALQDGRGIMGLHAFVDIENTIITNTEA